MKEEFLLSIVTPVYRAEKIIPELIKQVVRESEKITPNFEFILVEDGSPDQSWEKIVEHCNQDVRLKGVKLSRNFGQQNAVTAGLERSRGEMIIVLDCDLQDDPKDFIKLINKANEGYDTVLTLRKQRKHNLFKKLLSKVYKSLFSLISNEEYSLNNGSLYLLRRKVVNEISQLKNKPRIMGQVIRWVGFNIGYIEVVHQQRYEGQSSYTFSKLMKEVWDGWIANSDRLLKIVIYLGMFISIVSFLMAVIIIFLKFYRGFAAGWSSIVVSILFSTGLILSAIGILGLYIGRIFDQTKHLPFYIVSEHLNDNNDINSKT